LSEEVKEEVWSWSRINGFRQGIDENPEGCGYSWWLSYRENDRGVGNYFTEYGLLGHEMIEKYNKGELFEWDIEDTLESGLTKFDFKAPFPKMGQGYDRKIREFFCTNSAEGVSFADRFAKYEFLESEQEMFIDLEGYKIRGFIDAVANHTDYGLIVVDYKSSKAYEKEKLKNNIMQLYLYSIGIKEKYGQYPDHLMYYYFKEDKKEYAYPFSLDELDRTKQFVLESIEMSKKYTDVEQFPPRCSNVPDNDFYAKFLCNQRFTCPHSKLVNKLK
jgi:hypothetical protein